jgi:uncharacterized membrane protein
VDGRRTARDGNHKKQGQSLFKTAAGCVKLMHRKEVCKMAISATQTGIRWSEKAIGTLIVLALLPNLLGMLNLSTSWGFKLHFFQAAIFLASFLLGRWGGLIAGVGGSLSVAAAMGNPYILFGNALLGFFSGYFSERGSKPVMAVLLAFLIQLPWLIATDYLIMGLSAPVIGILIASLAVSNALWAFAAAWAVPPLRRFLG